MRRFLRTLGSVSGDAFSHGYTGSPLSSDYIFGAVRFRKLRLRLIAPFHGDLRFSDLRIDNLSDVMPCSL